MKPDEVPAPSDKACYDGWSSIEEYDNSGDTVYSEAMRSNVGQPEMSNPEPVPESYWQ